MYEAVQQCKHCGAGLSLEDLRKPNCTYCGTVFPHHAQAAQHAQVIGQVMGQMMQQQASPYGDPMRMAQAQMAHASTMSRTITMVVVGITVAVFALVVVGGVAAWLLF